MCSFESNLVIGVRGAHSSSKPSALSCRSLVNEVRIESEGHQG